MARVDGMFTTSRNFVGSSRRRPASPVTVYVYREEECRLVVGGDCPAQRLNVSRMAFRPSRRRKHHT